jgi:hypothetical protein
MVIQYPHLAMEVYGMAASLLSRLMLLIILQTYIRTLQYGEMVIIEKKGNDSVVHIIMT